MKHSQFYKDLFNAVMADSSAMVAARKANGVSRHEKKRKYKTRNRRASNDVTAYDADYLKIGGSL